MRLIQKLKLKLVLWCLVHSYRGEIEQNCKPPVLFPFLLLYYFFAPLCNYLCIGTQMYIHVHTEE